VAITRHHDGSVDRHLEKQATAAHTLKPPLLQTRQTGMPTI
jgi:hypothetical protein